MSELSNTAPISEEDLALLRSLIAKNAGGPYRMRWWRELIVRLDAAERAISSHNAECEEMCGDKSRCGYKEYSRQCPNCSRYWMVECGAIATRGSAA